MAQKKLVNKLPALDPARESARMREIINILRREYPEAHCFLNHESPFQLLIATILSAQCTDDRVNKTTPALFVRFPDAQSMAKAKLSVLEKLIQSTGFYRAKAKSISETAKALMDDYQGVLPQTIEQLTRLRGVGRKTANVVLGNAFGIQSGIVVDTHVGRLSRRLGFSSEMDPVKVEMDLQSVVPKVDWTDFSHLLISHGRAICTSRRADCENCSLRRYCLKIGVT
jgi:endonuclease-3